MEIDEEKEVSYLEPVSPTGQYFSTSILSPFNIIAVLESEIPIADDVPTMALLQDLFLPINPRFSSIMVVDKHGVKRWKKVKVNLIDHVNFPTFLAGMTTEFYDKCFDDYLSEIAIKNLPETQPLWEVHIVKYPTSQAAGNLIFNIHHSLGDGFSLMGALLSCLQRADNPSLPLTFPHVQLRTEKNINICKKVPKMLSLIRNTVSDFCSSMIRGSLIEDDISPIRSKDLRPAVSITTVKFSLDHIKQIKTKLGVSVNDVITGAIFLGIRLYMEAAKKGSGNADSTSLVMLNTRMIGGYKSVQEMIRPDAKHPWGNRFAVLPISIPKLTAARAKDPLQFVRKTNKIVKKKRNSFSVFLAARCIQLVSKFGGTEAAAQNIYNILKSSSMVISNLIGPVEKMALYNYPIKGLYFVATGIPQSIYTGIVSYMGHVRVAMLLEKDFIDPQKLRSYTENAFDMILKAAASTTPSAATNSID